MHQAKRVWCRALLGSWGSLLPPGVLVQDSFDITFTPRLFGTQGLSRAPGGLETSAVLLFVVVSGGSALNFEGFRSVGVYSCRNRGCREFTFQTVP